MRGCFFGGLSGKDDLLVLPAYAGMFLESASFG